MFNALRLCLRCERRPGVSSSRSGDFDMLAHAIFRRRAGLGLRTSAEIVASNGFLCSAEAATFIGQTWMADGE